MTPKYQAGTTPAVLFSVIPAPVKKAGQAGRNLLAVIAKSKTSDFIMAEYRAVHH